MPALYPAFMFGKKLIDGVTHSREITDVLGVIPVLKDFAYQLAPFVGVFDFCVALALLLNPYITKNPTIQKVIFIWVALWPFVPNLLRYFGKVGDFEVIELVSLILATALSYYLWKKFSPLAK